jgi:tetratricopeptide (TPR) repeat protein
MRSLLAACCLGLVLFASAASRGETDLEVLRERGDWSGAEALARRQVSADTGDPLAWRDLGRVLFERGRPEDLEEALAALERAVALDPGLASAWFWQGRAAGQAAGGGGVLKRIRLAGKSRDAFGRAVALEPESFLFTYALVQFHLQAPALVGGDARTAAALAAGFPESRPDERALLEAAVRLAARDLAGAWVWLEGVEVSADPLVAATWETLTGELGFARLRTKDWAEALEVYQKVTERLPEVASGWLGLGRALAGLERTGEAAAACRQCLFLAPSGPVAEAAQAVLAGLPVEAVE